METALKHDLSSLVTMQMRIVQCVTVAEYDCRRLFNVSLRRTAIAVMFQ